MYITGTALDLLQRLHFGCQSAGDYNSYKSERDSYTDADTITQAYWDKELVKKGQILGIPDPTPPPPNSGGGSGGDSGGGNNNYYG